LQYFYISFIFDKLLSGELITKGREIFGINESAIILIMNKEAILILLDVGSSMLAKFSGQPEKSLLEVSVECLKQMLVQKIFNNKTHEVGLILFGSDEAEDGNTIYAQEIFKPNVEFVQNVVQLA